MQSLMVQRLTKEQLAAITEGNCPTCSSRGFVIGPMDDNSMQIECASETCRVRYDVSFFDGTAIEGSTLPDGPEWPSEP